MRWRRRKQSEQDLERELRSDLELEAEEQREKGLSPETAHYAALRAFGNTTYVKEDVRAMWGWIFLDRLKQDVIYALRGMRRSPGFTAVAVLSLALGIGANTAIYSLIDTVLLRMLPVPDPAQLVILDCLSRSGLRGSFSHGDYEWIRDRASMFSGVAASASWRIDWKTASARRRLNASLVSANFFAVLGVPPALGRAFEPASDPRALAVISYRLWQREFQSSPSALGSTMVLADVPFEIIGVAPSEFFGIAMGDDPDVYIPLTTQPLLAPGHSILHTRNTGWLDLFARLRPGVTAWQAREGLAVLYSAVRSELHIDANRDAMNRIGVSPGAGGISWLRARFSEPLHILMGLVALVLLIACANVSNLLLARAAARRREFAVRLAIGASRGRIAGQLLTECILIAALAGALSLAIAQYLSHLLLTLADVHSIHASLNWKTMAFTGALSLITGLVFGMAPSLRGARGDPGSTIKVGARSVGDRAWGWSLSHWLVTAQVALSLLLLITASLLIRTFRNLQRADTGFDRDRVIQVQVDPGAAGYKSEQMPGVAERMIERIQELPTVESASASALGFGWGVMRICCVSVEGRIARPDEEKVVRAQTVTPDYFRTMGIAILRGRSFTLRDLAGRPEVAVINESMARKYFGASDPVGAHFGWSPQESRSIEVVGVVKDARYENLREETPPMLYQSIWQRRANINFIEVRLKGGGAGGRAMSEIRAAMNEVDGRVPILDISPISAQVDRTLGQDKLLALLSAAFGLLALALASLGLYGLLSYGVARRTAEIGVRMALGAEARDVRRMVLSETLILAGVGLVVGMIAAIGAQRLIAAQLYGLSATDPATFIGAAALMIAVACAAGYVPARRASRVDPSVALRSE
jgi:predicted permease